MWKFDRTFAIILRYGIIVNGDTPVERQHEQIYIIGNYFMAEKFKYQKATIADLESRWDKNITNNIGDERWVAWKSIAIENHIKNKCIAFVVLHGEEPIGEGTLIPTMQCVEINGLRIDKQYEGYGHISKLVKIMEQYAKDKGYKSAIIGVEPKETRNLAIYLHWGYTTFEKIEISTIKDDEGMILFYSKKL